MPWYWYLLEFVSGLLLANGVPHFVAGISGSPFQSPFATPSGVGESSPMINVYWGFANLVGGGVLFGKFGTGDALGWVLAGAGVLVMGMFGASHFGKVRASKHVPPVAKPKQPNAPGPV